MIEVAGYRDRLYHEFGTTDAPSPSPEVSNPLRPSSRLTGELESVIRRAKGKMDFLHEPWMLTRQIEEKPILFAYKSPGGFDGVCQIERINPRDGRVVVICEQIDGNPGRSVTNTIEYIAFQLCEQFNINPEELTLIEHYDTWYGYEDEWNLVNFRKRPPVSGFEEPEWRPMREEDWRSLGFRPRRRRKKIGKEPASLICWYR